MSTIKHGPLPPPLEVVTHRDELLAVNQLREATYRTIYPSIDVYDDPHDTSAIIFFARDTSARIHSTARLVIDGALGLPEDPFFPSEVAALRKGGARLMELGRFIIQEGSASLLKSYYKAFFDAAVANAIDVILMAMKPHHVGLHRRLMGARVLADDMGLSYGGSESLVCVAWTLANTPQRFFDWTEGGVK